MTTDHTLRVQLAEFLNWRHAHVDFDAAVKDVPPGLRGKVPQGFTHSAWQIVEHIRLAQQDILEFCRNPKYREKKWPEDYWPKAPSPKNATAWSNSMVGVRRDLRALRRLATDRQIDLSAKIPHGSGQTYLRELLLVADHTAYHVGQIVDLRRALGNWK
jgi:uncharacterized damage-inducible protein DinB